MENGKNIIFPKFKSKFDLNLTLKRYFTVCVLGKWHLGVDWRTGGIIFTSYTLFRMPKFKNNEKMNFCYECMEMASRLEGKCLEYGAEDTYTTLENLLPSCRHVRIRAIGWQFYNSLQLSTTWSFLQALRQATYAIIKPLCTLSTL